MLYFQDYYFIRMIFNLKLILNQLMFESKHFSCINSSNPHNKTRDIIIAVDIIIPVL